MSRSDAGAFEKETSGEKIKEDIARPENTPSQKGDMPWMFENNETNIRFAKGLVAVNGIEICQKPIPGQVVSMEFPKEQLLSGHASIAAARSEPPTNINREHLGLNLGNGATAREFLLPETAQAFNSPSADASIKLNPEEVTPTTANAAERAPAGSQQEKGSTGTSGTVAVPIQTPKIGREVASPSWLPPGWKTIEKTRTAGKSAGTKDKYYIEDTTKRQFRSKNEVTTYLEKKSGISGAQEPVKDPSGVTAVAGKAPEAEARLGPKKEGRLLEPEFSSMAENKSLKKLKTGSSAESDIAGKGESGKRTQSDSVNLPESAARNGSFLEASAQAPANDQEASRKAAGKAAGANSLPEGARQLPPAAEDTRSRPLLAETSRKLPDRPFAQEALNARKLPEQSKPRAMWRPEASSLLKSPERVPAGGFSPPLLNPPAPPPSGAFNTPFPHPKLQELKTATQRQPHVHPSLAHRGFGLPFPPQHLHFPEASRMVFPQQRMLHETDMASLHRLANQWAPGGVQVAQGVPLTAPIFERISLPEILQRQSQPFSAAHVSSVPMAMAAMAPPIRAPAAVFPAPRFAPIGPRAITQGGAPLTAVSRLPEASVAEKLPEIGAKLEESLEGFGKRVCQQAIINLVAEFGRKRQKLNPNLPVSEIVGCVPDNLDGFSFAEAMADGEGAKSV